MTICGIDISRLEEFHILFYIKTKILRTCECMREWTFLFNVINWNS
jgi:hypothetical protein